MKFLCDRCGRRFSSAAEPQPGLVYRYRCHCGNVIHVQVPAAGGAPVTVPPPAAPAPSARPPTGSAPAAPQP
ncbi:MAG: hypothetical protein NDI82_05445, partial [Anaeromyxobacteraceae bacterium]|nr:hypothetical protein [Anaeromyxobacteraceae bacterium]